MIQQTGLTLWELLITLLLVTTGVTGSVSLQLYLIQQGRLAGQATQAALITLALSEQSRTAASVMTLCEQTFIAGLPVTDMTVVCTDNTAYDQTYAAEIRWQAPPNTAQSTSRLPFRLFP